jgi:hypothetical protein
VAHAISEGRADVSSPASARSVIEEKNEAGCEGAGRSIQAALTGPLTLYVGGFEIDSGRPPLHVDALVWAPSNSAETLILWPTSKPGCGKIHQGDARLLVHLNDENLYYSTD